MFVLLQVFFYVFPIHFNAVVDLDDKAHFFLCCSHWHSCRFERRSQAIMLTEIDATE